MTNCTNESQTLKMRSLFPSPVNPAAQFPLHTTAPTDHIPRPRIPASEEDNLALASRLSQLSSMRRPTCSSKSSESAMTREQTHPFPPPNESDEDDLALNLSQLPADIFDEQAIEINQQTGSHTADANSASMTAAKSVLEVCMVSSLCPDKPLIFGSEHAERGPSVPGVWQRGVRIRPG